MVDLQRPSPALNEHAFLAHLSPKQIDALRWPGEKLYLSVIFVFEILLFAVILAVVVTSSEALLIFFIVVSVISASQFVAWLSWRLTYWYVCGNSILVSESQYPHIYRVVQQASECLNLGYIPRIFISQGHGMLDLILAKRFSRRGMILITSNLLDDLLLSGDTRRLMMIVGRMMGHLAANHLRWWFFKDLLGALVPFVYSAYKRSCNYTADRIGLLICGNLQEALTGMLTVVVGRALAPQTNMNAINEQIDELKESLLAWLLNALSLHPYVVERISMLEFFHKELQHNEIADSSGKPIQILNITHFHLTGVQIGTQIIGDNAVITVEEKAEGQLSTTDS